MRKFCFTLLAIFVQFSCMTKDAQNTSDSKIVTRPAYVDPYPLPEDAFAANVTGNHGGRIVTATLTDPKTFNPLITSESDSQTLNQLMHPGLTKLNLKTQQPEPALAKSWESSADHLVWTFHLRKGVKWSDGQPFSANDVIFTMEMVNDARLGSGAHDVLNIEGKPIQWTRIDAHTVRAKLPDTFGPLLRQLDGGTVPIIAKHKWEKSYRDGKFAEAMQVNMNLQDFVSCGAFVIKDYRTGQKLTLGRNRQYWKKDKTGKRLPYLDEIVFLVVPSLDQIELKIESGEVDTYLSVRPEDVETLKARTSKTHLKIYNLGPTYDYEGVFFNQNGGRNPKTGKPYVDPVKRSWFSDANFRKAVSYGIDRKALVQNAFYGKAVPSYALDSVSTPWYNQRIAQYPYDVKKAVELLRSSGFTWREEADGNRLYDRNGHEVRFRLETNSGNTIRNTECSLIVSDLARLGMMVEYRPVDFNSLVSSITHSFDFDAVLLGLTHDDTDPSSGMNVLLSSGSLHFWWPLQKTPQTQWEKRIDELMLLQHASFDQTERKRYYDEVQQIMSDQQPMIFTVTQFIYVCARENIGNLQPTISRHRTLWNGDELYWK